MCLQLSFADNLDDVAKRYNRLINTPRPVQSGIDRQYRVSAYNYPDYPIITNNPYIEIASWGLIPFWIKEPMDAYEIRRKTLNARSETIFEKRSYSEAVRSHRCIIPATGFFEWRHENDEVIPYFIYLKNEKLFSIAGLYDSWKDPDSGNSIKTFTLITTTGNSLMNYIHNSQQRMPVILSAENEKKWLSPDLSQTETESFLKPFPESEMAAYQVNRDFLKMRSSDPEIIKEVS